MKIVIVGAGRGLGHVLAQMLAEKGHTVVAGLRRLDDIIQLWKISESERWMLQMKDR